MKFALSATVIAYTSVFAIASIAQISSADAVYADTTATILSTIRPLNGPNSAAESKTKEPWEDGSASPPNHIKTKDDELYGNIKHPVLNTGIHESLAGKPISDFQLRGLNKDLYYDSIGQGVYLQRNLAFELAEKEAVSEFMKRVNGRTKQDIVDTYGPPSVDLGNKSPWTLDKPERTYVIYCLGYKSQGVILTFENEKCIESKLENVELMRELYIWQLPDRTKAIGMSEAAIIEHLGTPQNSSLENGKKIFYYPFGRHANLVFSLTNGICTDCERLIRAGWSIKSGSIQKPFTEVPGGTFRKN